MYVFRPQQAPGHTPGCSSASNRASHHHVGRQAAKNQRRTQPKQRRPQAHQRHRHVLRDLVGHVRHRACLTADGHPSGAAHPVHSSLDALDAAADNARGSGKSGVRARLRARLLQRSCDELVATLERRHGDIWAAHVLRGDLNAVEGMRRICEAFCLRPELERQVLKATTDRARAIHTSLPKEKQAPDVGGIVSREAGNSAEGNGKDIDASAERILSWRSSRRNSRNSRTESELETLSTSDGDSVSGTLDGTCSEAPSVEESLGDGQQFIWERGLQMPMPVRAVSAQVRAVAELASDEELADTAVAGSSSGGSSSECEGDNTIPLRLSWRSRMLRALGLQRLWHGRAATSDTASQAEQLHCTAEPDAAEGSLAVPCGDDEDHQAKKDGEEDKAEEEEEEEDVLSSKLIAAVRNAELHAASARAEQALRCRHGSSNNLSSDAALATVEGCELQSNGSKASSPTSIHFAKESEVTFFSLHHSPAVQPGLTPALLAYRRSLETKVFDGPSGHKAKRTTSSDAKVQSFKDEDEVSTGASSENSADGEDDEEEWEDHCDDIAELMSQQRSCLLWSSAW